MNAAAREIQQSNLFSGQWSDVRLSRSLCFQIVLMLSVLISALAVVYVTNLHRMTIAQLQLADQKSQELQLQWGQLLLEQASLATPGRVQQLAEEKLHMMLPAGKQTVILRVQ